MSKPTTSVNMKGWKSKMHDNHNTDLLSDWDLSQLQDDEDQEEEPEQEYSGELPW
jgi:hypothetical protein